MIYSINLKCRNVNSYIHLIIYLQRYVKRNIKDTSEIIHFTKKNTYTGKKEHHSVDFKRASQGIQKCVRRHLG